MQVMQLHFAMYFHDSLPMMHVDSTVVSLIADAVAFLSSHTPDLLNN